MRRTRPGTNLIEREAKNAATCRPAKALTDPSPARHQHRRLVADNWGLSYASLGHLTTLGTRIGGQKGRGMGDP
jgi:hypothetical protein